MLMPRFAFLVFAVLGSAVTAEPVVEKTAPPPTPVVAPLPMIATIPEEEKWIFEPAVNRTDVFNDIEERLKLEVTRDSSPTTVVTGPALLMPDGQDKIDAALEWAAKEADRVDSLILVRKWDETIQACDNAVKSLDKYQSNTPVAELIERFKRYRTQAEDAKIYEEAQAKFDALGLKVEGILWSPEGSLAVIGGEPRALKINDRAKDCVIINIDTNRVDFRFHHNQRRFEFQRYVGEVVNASRAH